MSTSLFQLLLSIESKYSLVLFNKLFIDVVSTPSIIFWFVIGVDKGVVWLVNDVVIEAIGFSILLETGGNS